MISVSEPLFAECPTSETGREKPCSAPPEGGRATLLNPRPLSGLRPARAGGTGRTCVCSDGSEGVAQTSQMGRSGRVRDSRFGSPKSLPEKHERRSRTVIPDGPLEAGGPPCHRHAHFSRQNRTCGPRASWREPGSPPGSPFRRPLLLWNRESAARRRPFLGRGFSPAVLFRSAGTTPAPRLRRGSPT